ncbi:Glucose-methanol-choline oxidoreductase [Penicillium concentricum]|uniref:Glucose-methanol-choline oxidoreductase n=1 Tax=Penicillium concentricum TaxID=293559 RepID=A0A9W9SR77_9EURO|nr:Glucose-methanol-choline oxidoreductase [Penicillium concentricum]KAJ5383042.1 Glucose-methanol-choline oxidoreductase [Penicillium concentricum]
MKALFFQGLLAIIAAIPAVARPHPDSNPDYVIVGGGPAGFVLADQLSQNPNTQVILLEAGHDGIDDKNINTPAYYPLISGSFWEYSSQPDPNLDGHAPGLQQGRVFGGGTAVNGMAYCRGSASLFDEWAQRSGNPGLAWNSLLEDFKATTHYTDQPADYPQIVNKSAYGKGPLEVSRVATGTGFDEPFAQALESSLGVHEVDLNDGTGLGLSKGLQSIRASNRTRSYARNAFGFRLETRPNVQMISNAWVQRIGFAGHKAINVTYLDTVSNKVHVLPSKEIIVSSGAINTPKILKLSGVGPAAELSELGIPVVADIPSVGAQLYDHQFGVVEVEVTSDIMTVWQWATNSTEKALAEEQYKTDASGPLALDNGLLFATFRVPDSVFDGIDGSHYTSLPADRPHVLMEYSTVPFIATTPNISTVTAWASLVQPEAAGTVTLNSSDYRDAPMINSNYYGSPADKAVMLWSYKKLREIMASDPLKSVVIKEWYPGPNVTSDEDVWSAIQKQSFSFHHPVGTVPIGKSLDKNWRLKGLKGIRVVDSSTFPYPPTCHPEASVYALAHRAAADIRLADRRH